MPAGAAAGDGCHALPDAGQASGNGTIIVGNPTLADRITHGFFGGTFTFGPPIGNGTSEVGGTAGIVGFGAGNTLDIAGTIDTAIWSAGTLAVSNGGTTVANLPPSGDYASVAFTVLTIAGPALPHVRDIVRDQAALLHNNGQGGPVPGNAHQSAPSTSAGDSMTRSAPAASSSALVP